MKNITLLTFLCLFSHLGFSQLNENFDTAPAAPAGGGVWTLASGDWRIFDNGVGTVNWQLNTAAFPAYSAPNAAFINNQFIGQGNTSMDYLATPLVTMPANPQLRFQTRMSVAGNQGTIYQIRAAASTSDPSLAASYTTLVAEFSEDDLSVPGNLAAYNEKVVSIPASVGASAYIAFVKIFTQPTGSLSGDRWLVDDIQIVSECFVPTTLVAGGITQTSANLSWANPSGATEWEIEIMPFAATPTGTGVVIDEMPFTATAVTNGSVFGAAFTPSTQYKFRVRAICDGGLTSDWSDVFAFSTQSPGQTCSSPIVFTTPYSTTDNTANYGDTTDVNQGACAGTTANYMTGNDVFYSYTPATSGAISITMTPTGTWSGIFVYEGCANVGVNCLAGVANSGATIREIPSLNVTAGQEYIIVISTNASPQTVAYTLVVQTLNCAAPTNLSATGTGPDSANLSWSANGATSWEVAVQTAGSAIPSGAGITATTNTNFSVTETLAGAPLVLGTPYQYWVRSDCGDGTFSTWAGPYLFNTTSCTSGCNFTFVMTDSANDGWNGNTMNVIQGGVTIAVIGSTFTSGGGPVTVSVPLCDGPFQLFWNAGGTWAGEVGVSVVNSHGQTVYTKAPGTGSQNSLLYTGNVNCNNPDCMPPTNLTVSGVTQESATLAWTAGGPETEWEIIVVASGAPIPDSDDPDWETATNPVTVSGLNPGTSYAFYVRGICSSTEISTPAGPRIFNTTQIPATLPYEEDFEDDPQMGISNGTAVNQWVIGDAVSNGGTQSLYISNNNGDTNTFTNTASSVVHAYRDIQIPAGVDELNLSFDWRAVGESCCDYIRVWMVPTSFTPAVGTQITAAASGGVQIGANRNMQGEWQTENQILQATAYAGQIRRLIFEWRNDGSVGAQPPGAIDNINLHVISCSAPSALVLNSITQSDATVSWTGPTSGAQSFDYYYSTTNTPPSDTTTPSGNVTTPNTEVSGLESSTTYYLWVRSDCGPDGTSTWSGPLVMTTTQVPAVLPLFEDFEDDPQFTLSNGTATNKWVVGTAVSNGGTHSLYISNNNGAANAFTTTSAATVHAYRDIQMPAVVNDLSLSFDWRAVGESCCDYIRVWMVPTTFSPTPGTQITAAASGGTQLGANYNMQGNWQTANFVLPGAPYAGQTMRLIFEWRNDGSVGTQPPGAIDNIQLTALTCPRPTALASADVTQNSAMLSWTENGTATSWEIFIVPQGSPAPNAASTGTIVSINPVLMTGLFPGMTYTFYVRAICDSDDISIWSVGANLTTLPANDDCSGATFAPVNSNAVCNQIVSGTLFGATASGTPALAPCIGNANNDVWFQFIATNSYLNIALSNVVGTSTNINHAVYSGDCNGLTLLHCSAANSLVSVANNMVVGNTYYIRVYSNGSTPVNTTFNLCISTPSTCSNSSTVCDTTYGNTVGVTSLGQIGCLFTSPNPTFFTIQVQESGPITYLLTQASTGSTTPDLDVDYAAWGPFTSQTAGCTAISGGLAPNAGCSYSAAATENFNIPNAVAGQYYIILITNYANQPGTISLTQTNANNPGAGETFCCADGNFSYTPASYCTSSTENPIPVIAPGSEAGVFSASGTGLVFVDTATGEIDLSASQAGIYVITNTLGATDSCGVRTYNYTVTISEPVDATISYDAASYCTSETTPQLPTFTGTTGGYYAVTPPGLFINTTTGAVTPSASNPGMYTVSYNLMSAGACAASAASFQIEIFDAPDVVAPDDITVCGSYTLPALAEGNYFTETMGEGTALFEGDVISSTQTIYVFGGSGDCTDEDSFTVTVNNTPNLDPVDDVFSCEPYMLPALTEGDYYDTSGGTGTPLDITIPITTSQTVYVYATNGSCSAELSFEVTIGDLQVTAPSDITVCDEYELPVLILGNYYTMTGGDGDMLPAGTIITETTTLYVFHSEGTCTDEEMFTITFAPITADAPADVVECTMYELPVLSADNTYYTETGGPTGTGSVIPVSTVYDVPGVYTIYVYADNGDCTDEHVFTVTISGPVVADVLPSVTVCDEFILPVLSANNNYFTEPMGGGIPMFAGDAVTTDMTIYIYAVAGDCTDESSFTVTVAPAVADEPADVVECTEYELPALNPGNAYYTATGGPTGTGVEVPAGTVYNTVGAYTLYVYADNGNCTDEHMFTVTITGAVTADVLAPVEVCDSYILQGLSANNNYFTEPNGGGMPMSAGDVITQTTTLYVYAVSGTCTDESTFIITINPTPIIPQMGDVTACDSYVLPTIAVGDYYTAPDGPNGAGTQMMAGDVITADTTMYIYAQTGTTIICSAEDSFDITITPSPVVNPISDVIACESYTLPAIVGDGDYYDQPDGQGSMLLADDVITSSQTVYVYADNGVCQPQISFQVTIGGAPEFTISGECDGNDYVLTVTPLNNSFDPDQATYTWTAPPQGVIKSNGTTASPTVSGAGIYTVVVTLADSGCTPQSGEFNATSTGCQIQKGISPNGDNMNDCLKLEAFNVDRLSIFNRYGMKVYERANYVNEWCGQSDKGDELPAGTYYYMIERAGESATTGWIYITREQ